MYFSPLRAHKKTFEAFTTGELIIKPPPKKLDLLVKVTLFTKSQKFSRSKKKVTLFTKSQQKIRIRKKKVTLFTKFAAKINLFS